MDADGWRRVFVSRDYGDARRKAIALLIKEICIEEIDDSSFVTINGIKNGTAQ